MKLMHAIIIIAAPNIVIYFAACGTLISINIPINNIIKPVAAIFTQEGQFCIIFFMIFSFFVLIWDEEL